MASRVLLRNPHSSPGEVLNIPPPHWIPYPLIKWTSIKKANSKRGLLCLWSRPFWSHCFGNKLSFTLNSVLAHILILSCAKPRTHSGSWILGSPDPRTSASVPPPFTHILQPHGFNLISCAHLPFLAEVLPMLLPRLHTAFSALPLIHSI